MATKIYERGGSRRGCQDLRKEGDLSAIADLRDNKQGRVDLPVKFGTMQFSRNSHRKGRVLFMRKRILSRFILPIS